MLDTSKAFVPEPAQKPESVQVAITTREEILARLQDPSLILVNVMPPESFQAGHIPRSINLPVAEIESRATQVFPHKAREITVYCSGPT